MTAPLFAERQDLLVQRRLESGLPAEPKPLPSARRLAALGALIGASVWGLVLGAWLLAALRHQQVKAELAALQAIPATLNALEKQIPGEKERIQRVEAANDSLVGGLVAASSGSALLTQLSAITPAGIQLKEVNVQDGSKSLSLKGLSLDPMAFRRLNALTLLLGRSSLFVPTSISVVKVIRDEKAAQPVGSNRTSTLPPLSWELSLKLSKLPAPVLLHLLRGLDAQGMAQRLLLLERIGAI